MFSVVSINKLYRSKINEQLRILYIYMNICIGRSVLSHLYESYCFAKTLLYNICLDMLQSICVSF